jgi:oxygen-independent coproporphyrinogen-3 oxidase
MYEEGTPLTARNPEKLDEGLEREMYDLIRRRLTGAGFIHYEISNFAKPGFECRHNLLYWSGGEYLGIGPAAHSHWKGVRWANLADLDGYCAKGSQREFEETLDPEAKDRETLVMGLRRLEGVEVSSSLWENLQESFRALEKAGLLVIDGRRVRLSEEALFVSDAVFAELV